MQCPTCRADADIVVNEKCYMCGDEKTREMIEKLRPE